MCVCVRMYMLRMVAEPVNPLRREATYLSDALTGGRFTLCYVSRVSPVVSVVWAEDTEAETVARSAVTRAGAW